MFGNRFARDYGDSAPSTWANCIGALHGYELERGLKNLLAKGSGTPPTLPQFLRACREADESGGMERNHSPQKSLPNPDHEEPVHAHAQRCMFAYLWDKGAASDDALAAMIEAKNRVVHQFRCIRDEDKTVTGKDIKLALFRAWAPLWKPRTAAETAGDYERMQRTGNVANKVRVDDVQEHAA